MSLPANESFPNAASSPKVYAPLGEGMLPEFVPLPPANGVEFFSGLRRGVLNSLILCTTENGYRPPGKSYSQIVQMLQGQGFEFSLSAVHAFVRVRARQERVQYALPSTTESENAKPCAVIASHGTDPAGLIPVSSSSSTQDRVVRYVPATRRASRFKPGDLAINDPFRDTDT